MELPVIQPGRPIDRQPIIFEKIGIVGLGLIGGSIALAARELWPSSLVVGVDNKDVLENAMRLHAVDVAADDLVVLAEVDVVILAAPVRQNLAVLGELDENVRTPAIVTDVGSTKRAIVDAAKMLPPRFTFVGGHPLGGSTKSGLEHARTDLFKGRPWIFTPSSDKSGDAVDKLVAFATALGADPRVIGVDAHDRMLAFLSHLPQLTASALMEVVGDAVGDDGLALAGRGLVDTTRLAGSSAEIWKDIAATNADEIGAALDTFISILTELRGELKDGERLGELFESAARWRERLVR
ncbi:MAG TPA: prephenate dehydrogenase/arogenate dehydrogenase family protein [Vicinamibacterales bacterium]|nr:prephenate dehydrogenase/arogenate dehydrogenase family protein [Vicinamibacterales bacterium]